MEENKNRAKLLTVGIAIVLILIICGISMVIYALNRRSDREASQALQDDIMNYVNTSQEQNVTAQEITKEEEPAGGRSAGSGRRTRRAGTGSFA